MAEEVASKIIKLDTEVSNNSCENLKSFESFQFKRLLNENPENKLSVIEGSFEAGGGSDNVHKSSSIVILEKTHFTVEDVKSLLCSSTEVKKIFSNDIYGNFLCYPNVHCNAIKATVIHPATPKHILKYSKKNVYIVQETSELYQSITLPYILESKFDNQWVYNILEHKKETDRIVCEDSHPETGFILLPDLKWDGTTLSNLYLTGIVCDRTIKSLRDLTSKHLPLLENLLYKGSAAIKEKYNLPPSQLRIYLHYQPSFYHLHAHFTSLQFTPPGCTTERAHLLKTVIDNIKLCGNYYQEIPLSCLVYEGDPLLNKFQEKLGCLNSEI